jgi:hypothetical protein
MSAQKKSSVVWVVAGVLILIGVGMLLGSAYVLLTSHGRQTGPVGILAFGWAALAMAASIIAAAASSRSRVLSDQSDARRGTVTIERPSLDNTRPAQSLTGPGVEVSGETTLRVGSRVPAIILGLASALLLVAMAALFVEGRATPVGAGIGLAICFFMANWTRNAWPRPKADEDKADED